MMPADAFVGAGIIQRPARCRCAVVLSLFRARWLSLPLAFKPDISMLFLSPCLDSRIFAIDAQAATTSATLILRCRPAAFSQRCDKARAAHGQAYMLRHDAMPCHYSPIHSRCRRLLPPQRLFCSRIAIRLSIFPLVYAPIRRRAGAALWGSRAAAAFDTLLLLRGD